jgi:hypothetical protein
VCLEVTEQWLLRLQLSLCLWGPMRIQCTFSCHYHEHLNKKLKSTHSWCVGCKTMHALRNLCNNRKKFTYENIVIYLPPWKYFVRPSSLLYFVLLKKKHVWKLHAYKYYIKLQDAILNGVNVSFTSQEFYGRHVSNLNHTMFEITKISRNVVELYSIPVSWKYIKFRAYVTISVLE